MKFPSLPFLEKKEKSQYFLSLILRDDKAIAIVFEETLGKLKLIGQGEEKFEESIEQTSEEDLLEICDKIISKAETPLPNNVETQKAIFSLKDSWVENNKIKKEYLDKLKKISDELGLTPIGFLQTSEAIINLLQKEEGAPISAVFAQISRRNVVVSLLKASRFVETKKSEIHESAPFTVDTVLKHFEVPEILPSRLIISSSQEKDLSQEFIAHHWSKSLPFMHLPQIHVLPSDFDVRAVMSGAAKQMGFEMMPEFKKEVLREVEKMEGVKLEEPEKIGEGGAEEGESEQEQVEESENKGEDLEKFGFILGDISKIEPTESEPVKEEPEIIGVKDMAAEKEEYAVSGLGEDYMPKQRGKTSPLAGIMAGGTSLLKGINFKALKGINLKGKGALIPIGIVLVILILGFFLVSAKKATVNLTLSPKSEQQNQNVTFSLSGSTNPENMLIAAESVDTSEDGSVTTNATGKKQTGDPAKGTVTFYSRFTDSKTIPSGTIITSNDLSFTTDKDVKVASSSADASASPSTVSVSVTAKKIGKESNLPSGTKFNVANFSTGDIIAKNDSAFSGGSQKDITVVSKDDYTKLQDDLIKNLEQKAKDDLSKKISSDKALLSVFLDESIDKTDYSKKVDDEASQVTLKGTVSYTGLAYVKNDLTSFTKTLIANTSKDLNIDEKNLKVDVSGAKKRNDKQITATLKIDAKLLPKIDQADLINKIKGKPVNEATAELRQMAQVSDVKISISPPIPFFTNNLPDSPNRITFKVISNE